MRTEIDKSNYPRYFANVPGSTGLQGRAQKAEALTLIAILTGPGGGSIYAKNGWVDGTHCGPAVYERDWRELSEAEAYAIVPMVETHQLADKYQVPVALVEGILAYWHERLETGGFLRAVLEHDLFEAVGRADRQSTHALSGIVKLIYNELPSTCHGSKDAVEAWLAGRKRLEGAKLRLAQDCPECREEARVRGDAHAAGANVQSMPIRCPHPRAGGTGC